MRTAKNNGKTPSKGGVDTPSPGNRQNIPTQDNILTYDEIDRCLLVLAEYEAEVVTMFRLMLFAGLRITEAMAVEREHLITAAPCAVFVPHGKGDKARTAPVDLGTWGYARALAPEEGTICTMSVRTLRNRVKEIYSKAGIIRNLVPHDLRHTCATWQLDKGIPLEVVKNNLGHADITITQIYLHLDINRRSRMYKDATRFGL